jgi:hypothetical protein
MLQLQLVGLPQFSLAQVLHPLIWPDAHDLVLRKAIRLDF